MDDPTKASSSGSTAAPELAPHRGAGDRSVASTRPKDQRRLMSLKASAAYSDMCVKLFNVTIRPRLIPIKNPNATKNSRKLWFDRHAIDREIDRLSGLAPQIDRPPTSDDHEYVMQQLEKRLLARPAQMHRRRPPQGGRS